MTLNCLGAHNTRQRPGPPEQEPEVKCSRVTGAEEESWIVIQIEHRSGIGSDRELGALYILYFYWQSGPS